MELECAKLEALKSWPPHSLHRISHQAEMKHRIDPRIEKRIDEVSSLLSKPLNVSLTIAMQLRHKAKEHLIKKQYEDALECLDTAIDLDSGSYKLFRLRAVCYACLGDFASSCLDAEKVILISPNSSDGYYHKGFALFNLRRHSEAAHVFQQGLKINPGDAILKQGFWDSVGLVSQRRTDTSTLNHPEDEES